MENYWWCALLFRLVLPLVIITAAFLRPTLTSYVYMVVGCYMPFFSVPTSRTMSGRTGIYMKVLVVTCVLTFLLVLVVYFVLFFPSERPYEIEPCSTVEVVLRTIGMIDFEGLSFSDTLSWCLPEPLMLTTSVLLYVIFKKLCQDTTVKRAAIEMQGTEMVREITRQKIISMMLNFGKYFLVFLFCLTSIVKGTVFGCVYYFVFLLMMTYWACNQPLGTVFGRILVLLIPIIFSNVTITFWYQFQYFKDSEIFDPKSLWGRLLYLVEVKTYKDCTDPRVFKFHSNSVIAYVMVITRFILYYLTVLISREILQAKDGFISLIRATFTWKQGSDLTKKWHKALIKIQKEAEGEKLATPRINVLNKINSGMEQILHFIISIAYLLANFVMMIWGTMYVDWKSLLLLIWANLIWLMPFRKKVMLITSPLLVGWVWFMLGAGYLYSLNFTEEELPTKVLIFNLKWSGIDPTDKSAWMHRLTMSLFGIIIFVAMKQLWYEKAFNRQQKQLVEVVGFTDVKALKKLEQDQEKEKLLNRIQTAFVRFFAIWWIWVVIITMIWMAFWTTSTMFRIAFVALAILFLMTLQLCPFTCWKKFLWVYWWIVIVYAMINLLVVYMYQIHVTRKLMHKFISEKMFHRYGFQVWQDRRGLFMILAHPLFFQIAVVVQQNYFQAAFNKLTSPITLEEIQQEENKPADSGTLWGSVKIKFRNAVNVSFQILEVHLQNVVLVVGWFMCVFDLCALYVPFVLLLTASCVFGRTFTHIVIHFISISVQILILARMVYMNQYMDHKKWDYVGHYTRNGEPFNKTLNFADWLGFHQSRLGRDYADFYQLSWCFLYVFVVIMMRIVSIRMKNYRLSRNLPPPRNRVLFSDITYENCHQNLSTMFKFLANYGFFKFGCELTAVFATILMAVRMDAWAILVCCWLLLMFSLNRTWLRVLWLITLVITAILIPLQYLMTLGMWPTYWEKSLTRFWSSTDFLLRTQQFFHLSNMAHPPIKEKISLDFLFLLLISRQWRSFRIEWKFRGKYCPAGDNRNVASLIDVTDVDNPVPDFITYTRNNLDIFKKIFFTGWFYMALATTLLAGTMKVTVYSFGYTLGSFVFVWDGTNLFLRPPKTILRKWNMLIAYTILVMLTRCVIQVFGCIFIFEMSENIDCVIYQTFSVGCVDSFDMTGDVPYILSTTSCKVDYEDLGLGYDCLCFFFLILQQRIFKSYHFFHMVNDVKAQTILADRGAGLIEDKRQKTRQALDAENALIKDNIKKKMDRIRATHQKVQGEAYARRKKNNRQMLKSSDYYVFEDANLANDIPLLPPKRKEDESEFDPYDPMPFTEYFGLLYSSNIATVLAERTLRRKQKIAIQEGNKPENVKAALALKDSKPGTSKDPASRADISKTRKALNVITFMWGAFESIVVSVTGIFNRRTKVLRNILSDMHRDSITLKEKTKYREGIRLGSNALWQPVASYKDVLNAAAKKPKSDSQAIQYSIYFKLFRAVGYLLLSQSEWLCYSVIVLNQALSASFLSLPLVLIMFCWGVLTVPKPTKTFWIVSIAYILIMVFIHMFSMLSIVPWNVKMDVHRANLLFPPYVLGASKVVGLAYDIAVLVTLLFHRIVLQKLGLWKPFTYRTSKLIEDGYYNYKDGKFVPLPPDDKTNNPQSLVISNNLVSLSDYFPESVIHGLLKYTEGFKLFMQQLVYPTSTQIPVDVYTPMFICDLINMFLIMFYYGSFSSEDENENLITFIENNTVPMSFIVVVLMCFFLMVVDRAIYLRKNRFGKMVYYFFQVTVCHIWCFVLYPMLTNRYFDLTPVVQVFYGLKSMYFLFSAYQIRNGYPALISYHYLWHETTIVNKFAYKLYKTIPYFFEMRSLLDWMVSDSCLSVNDWFKMEEITQNIFDQTCEQDFDDKWGGPGGTAKNRTKKYVMGGILYVLLILTVIFPFLLFSLGDTVGVKTHPGKIKMELYMGSAEPIFSSYAPEKNLIMFSQQDYNNLTNTFNNFPDAEEIFGNFQPEDVAVVLWSPHSLTQWRVSPGTFNELMEDLLSNETFTFRLEIHYTHIGHGGLKQQKSFGQNTYMPPLPNENRKQLLKILKANETLEDTLWVPLLFPKFLMITKESRPEALPIMNEFSALHADDISAVEQDDLQEDDDGNTPSDLKYLRNVLVSLRYSKNGEMWWHLQEECSFEDDNYYYYLKDLVHNSCEHLVMYTFNEKVFSSTISYITQSGILGLYLLYFMLIIGVIRGCRIDIGEIWIEDLPSSKLMMRKCLEVYVARDMQNYELEEELYAELIFIMRSRETLIKLTRESD